MNFLVIRKLLLLVLLILALQTGVHHLLQKWGLNQGFLPLLVNLSSFFAVWALIHFFTRRIKQVVETLDLGVKCFQDNDFSITIENTRQDELGQLIGAYNDVATTIRKERMNLHQREILLDTIIQETPVALILTDASEVVIYSNEASKVLFKQTQKPDGCVFSALISQLPETLKQPTLDKKQGLYSQQDDQHKSVYYLNCQHFILNDTDHTLYLYKNMTTEISRQEVDLWKNAIRLMSHELNNSLAPIASLTHSAKDILNKPQHADMLPEILDTISERTARLTTFISQYAGFARLPSPSLKKVNLPQFITHIQRLCQCKLASDMPDCELAIDQGQMEQVLINLLKNAQESGSPVDDINLSVSLTPAKEVVFSVTDRGTGMSAAQLQQALLPFFSTKPKGTGLGLTLCNEIVTAHGGLLRVANREGGGLEIRFALVQSSIGCFGKSA